jgi:hypothetical protein
VNNRARREGDMTDPDELPAARLKAELLAAGLPVRAVLFDGGGFVVTYTPAVTSDDVARAAPLVAAAYGRQPRAEK